MYPDTHDSERSSDAVSAWFKFHLYLAFSNDFITVGCEIIGSGKSVILFRVGRDQVLGVYVVKAKNLRRYGFWFSANQVSPDTLKFELRSAEELCGARKFQSDGKSDMPLLLQCYSENLFARIDRGTSRVESAEADEAHFCIEKIRNSPIMEVY